MKKLVSIVLFVWVFCSASFTQCCTFTLSMFDSFGDGWNGGSLTVNVAGTNFGPYSASGSGSQSTFTACPGDLITLTYSSGAWEGENTYSLLDPNGTVLFSDGPNPTTGTVFNTNAFCPPNCFDGIQNGNETGIDCGGSCPPCHCSDGIQNNGETGVDCGGPCPNSCPVPCNVSASYSILSGAGGACGNTVNYNQTITISNPNLGYSNDFIFTSVPTTALSAGTLTINAMGDLNSANEIWTILSELGATITTLGASGSQCSSVLTITIPLSIADLNAWAADGTIIFQGIDLSSSNVNPNLCGNEYMEMTLSYDGCTPELSCNGGTVQLTAIGQGQYSFALNNDFDLGFAGTGWNASPAATFTNPCDPSVDGGTYMWMGDMTAAPRNLETNPLDVSCGGEICFYLDFATQGNASPCEGPDLPSEGVYLQFSTDGGATWTTINYFDPTAGNYTSWAQYCFPIPPAAQTNNTIFSWWQGGSSGTIYDHWGIDNVTITSLVNCDPYTYDWSHIPGTNNDSTTVVNVTQTSTYTVTYTNGTDTCSTSITVTVPDGPIIAGNVITNETCPGDCDGSASSSVTNSAGTPPYSYLWSNNATTTNVNNLCPGDYIITVTDDNNCTHSDTVTINPGVVLTPTISPVAAQCLNSNLFSFSSANSTISSGSISSYNWDFGDGIGSSTSANPTYSYANAGSYVVTLTISDGNCTESTSINVTVWENPSASATPSDETCFNTCDGAIDLTVIGSGGYTYSWNNGAGNQEDPNGLCPNTYDVLITDINGCQTTASAIINGPTLLSTSISGTDVSCNNSCDGSSTVNASGGSPGYTYLWNDPNAQTTATASNLCAGSYIVSVIDNNGCNSSANITINEPSILSASINSSDVSCNGLCDGSATVTANGGTPGYTYLWDDPNTQTTATASNLCAGVFTVTITDNNGCTQTSSVTINEPSILSTSIVGSDVSCFNSCDGSSTVTASGGSPGYSYLWNDPNAQTTATATNLCAGTFNVTISDNNGCTQTLTTTINEPTLLTNSISSNDGSCNNSCDGTATVNTSGGTQGYSYQWNDPAFQTTATATNLCAGSYSVIVTDNNGCIQNSSITINEPSAINLTTSSINSNCGNNDGQVSVIASGGTAGYTYLWDDPNTSTSATVNNLIAGTYIVTVTDANGCTEIATATISDNGSGTASISINNNISCNSLCNGSASATIVGGTGPFTYLWNNGETTSTASSLCAGTISVDITDANGCVVTVSDLITEPNILSSAITSFDDVTCNNLCDAVATVNVSGGTLGFTYLWNDPSAQTTASANNLCAGNYTVDITDANGCTTSASVTINEPTAINTSIIGNDVLCNNACDGSADLTVSGGTPGYTYLWDDPNSTSSEDISALCAGSYSVTITDANGCTGTENITINQPSALVLTPSSVNSNCGNSDGQVSVQVNGGTPNYSFLWNDPSASTTSVVNNLLAGNYSVIVTDNNGCNQNTSITISDNSPASIFHTQVDILCNGGNNGAIDVTLNGGNSPFTYNWIGPSGFTSNAQDLTGLTAGTYDLTCIDAVNCIVNLSVTISEPSPIILSTNGINATCFLGNDGEVSVSASGGMPGFSYNWYNNVTLTTNVGIGTNITNLTAGTYYVTVTDANGCTVNDNITISEPNEIIVTTSSIDATCGQSNGLISVSGTSGGSGIYVSEIWQDANGNSITNTTSVSAGSYYVTVTDDNGCTGNGIANVSDLSGPVGQIDGYGDASCYGSCDGFANIVVGGGTPNYTYVWQPQPGSGQGTTSATNLCAGIYTIDITDANGCATSVIVNINEPAQLSLTLASSSDASGSGICDGQATISTSGGSPNYSYFWFDDCNLTLPNTSINGTSVNNLCAGTYGVLVTDNNNCPDTLCITINEPNPIIISVTGNDVLCKNDCNGSATASVIGGVAPFNYQWYSAATNQSINQNSITATNLCSGTYYVVVTDANGVSMTSSNFTVNEPPILAANTSVISNYNGQDISCFGACDGAVEVIPIGGTSPYTYQWSVNANSQNTPIAINLCAGTYDVTVTDANGCISNVNISLTQPVDLTNSNTSSDVSCNGFCDGTISSNPLGGTTPYSYLWNNSNFSTTSSISNLCPGTYSVTITDANGCSTIETSTITEPNQLVILATSTGSNCNQNDGSATVSIVSGTPPYSFQWDNNAGAQTTATATNLFSGCYDVIINEGNGCIDTVNVCVTDLGAPTVSILTQTDVSCYNSCDGFAQIQVFGGAPPVQYNWYDQNNQPINQTTASAFNLCAGTYIGEMTDSNGCQASVNVIINEPLELNGIISANSSVTCFGDCDGTVTVTASSGTAPYNYQWNDPNFQTTANASNLCPGNYSVTITDNNNCSLTIPTTIGEPDQIQLTVNSTDAYCNTNSGSANVILNNGGVNPISYLWTPSGQTTSSATNLNPGNYAITVTDANGCTANSSTTVGNIPPGTASISNLTNTLCPGSCDGTATVSMSGTATAPFIYEWFTNSGLSIGQDSITAINLCAGYYYCVVTDANGCISFTNQFDISEPAPLSLVVDTDSSNCYASCNGQAFATVSGGTGSYQYQWDDPLLQITPTAFNLCAGTYTILATDNNGCTISSQVNIEQPNALILDSTVINANCGLSNGEGCVTVIGGIAPYNYLWPNNATTSCLNGLAAGSYLVEVTDANNCSQNIVVEISDIDGPIASIISVTNTSCYGSCDGSATVDMIGGSGTFFTVQWDSSAFNQTTPSASNLCAGTYTVNITDDIGCSSSAAVTINQPDTIQYIRNKTNPTCFGYCDGQMWVSLVGGTPPYSFDWRDNANNSLGVNNDSISGICSGNYIVIITDANGCVVIADFVLTDPPQVSASITTNSVSCYNLCDASATVTPSTGVGPFTYVWGSNTGSQTTQTATGLCAGNYTVTVTDSDGCTNTAQTTITEPTQLTCSITNFNNLSCNNSCDGFAQVDALGGTPGYTYIWNNNGGINQSASGLCAGNYTVTVIDANNCTSTSTVTISEPNPLVAVSSSIDLLCFNICTGEANVNVSGGTLPYSYQWDDPNFTTANNVANLCAGTYSCVITDSNNCSFTETIQITQPTELSMSISITDANCGQNNGQICMSPTGGTAPFTYQWNDPFNQTSACATNLLSNCYNGEILDANGCLIDSVICVNDISGPNVSLVNSTDVTCYGYQNGVIQINVVGGTGGNSISWFDNAGNILSSGNNQTILSTLNGGCYSIQAVDNAGCISSITTCINEPNLLTSSIANFSDVSCYQFCDGNATAMATGGVISSSYNYSWNDPNAQNTPTANGLCAGNYSVTITDDNNCSSTSNIVIGSPTQLSTNVSSFADALCYNSCDGIIEVSSSGGTSPYNYTWNNGTTSSINTNLCDGNYTVIVVDANGCLDSVSQLINEPTPLQATINTINSTCGACNGQATVQVSGGTSGYSYNWFNLGSSPIPNSNIGLCPGSFQVEVIDLNNCTAIFTDTIIDDSSPTIDNIGFTSPLCNGLSNGSAFVEVSGGTLPYTYLWDDPAQQQVDSAVALHAGIYCINVTDANGCITTNCVNVTEPNPLNGVPDLPDTICYGDSTQIWASGQGGTFPYTINWSNTSLSGFGPITVAPSSTTDYCFTVTDDNGCISPTSCVTISVTPPLSLSVTPSMNICSGGNVDVQAIASGGDTSNYNYNFAWTDENNFYIPSVENGDTSTINIGPNTVSWFYIVLSDGCSIDAIDSTEIGINPNPQALIIATDSINCAPLNTQFIVNSDIGDYFDFDIDCDGISDYSGTSNNLTYTFANSGLFDVCVRVTNSSTGCFTDLSIPNMIQVFDNPNAYFTTNTNQSTILNPSIEITDGSIGGYNYSWDFGDNSSIFGTINDVINDSTTTGLMTNLTHLYGDTGIFTITLIISDNNGCTDSYQQTISIEGDYIVFTPSAFTPNGDGRNDIFIPEGIGISRDHYEFYVFNRWGELIFESYNPSVGWDGTYKGKLVKLDAYVWLLRTWDNNQHPHEYMGHVTVVR